MTEAEKKTPETTTPAVEEKKIPVIPQRAPLPQANNRGFHAINNSRPGNFKNVGNKIGTKIQKHSSKGR